MIDDPGAPRFLRNAGKTALGAKLTPRRRTVSPCVRPRGSRIPFDTVDVRRTVTVGTPGPGTSRHRPGDVSSRFVSPLRRRWPAITHRGLFTGWTAITVPWSVNVALHFQLFLSDTSEKRTTFLSTILWNIWANPCWGSKLTNFETPHLVTQVLSRNESPVIDRDGFVSFQ